MVLNLPIAMLKEHLGEALKEGLHQEAQDTLLALVKVGQLWLQEIRESPTPARLEQARLFGEALAALDRTLRRNEEIHQFAPFLIGQQVEAEQIAYGPRTVWVPATILDFRPVAMRARLHRNPRALDYLIREEDGGESWRADESLRAKR